MGDPTREIIEYIDRRLATMERAPGSWGSAESLELQALLLLELRAFALRPRTHTKNPFEARNEYIKFVSRRFPAAPALLMSSALPADRVEDELPKLLTAMRDEIVGKLPPEDPFVVNELVVELAFRRPDAASFRSVCNYFLRFLRVGDALVSRGGAGDGRPTPLTWALPLVHAGESPDGAALVWLIFDRLRWKKATRRRFLDELAKVLEIIECARSEDATHERVLQAVPAEQDRVRVARHALRLYPRGKVTHVRVGGEALHHTPVTIEAVHEHRARALLGSAADSAPRNAERLRIGAPAARFAVPPEWRGNYPHGLPDEPPRFHSHLRARQ